MGMLIASANAVIGDGATTSNSRTSPSRSGRPAFPADPLTRTSPRASACATSPRERPESRATTTSVRCPASSAVTTCNKARKQQQSNPDGDARVGYVEDVWPDAVEVDKVDDVAVVHAIDDIA